MSLPDEAILGYRLACSKSCYTVLRALYEEPATAKQLADARGVTLPAVAKPLQKLANEGLVRLGDATPDGATHELTAEGRKILLHIAGHGSPPPALAGWLVASTVQQADPEEVRRVLDNIGETYECAGDADFISVLASEGQDLAIALANRVRSAGGSASRIFVMSEIAWR